MKTKKKTKTISILLSLSLFICIVPVNAFAVSEQKIHRIYGNDRYETSVAISKDSWEYTQNVIIANGTNFPDALAGVSLTSLLSAPILLTESSKLNPVVIDEIKRLGAKNAYILGGTEAVSTKVEETLKSLGCSIHRLSGPNRTETAAAIGKEISNYHEFDTVILATGSNYPDALSVGPISGGSAIPILFTDQNKLSEASKNFINKYNIKYVAIIGGTSVISSSVENELTAMGKNTKRISGANRYETSLQIGEVFKNYTNPDYITLATGSNFPDALAGGGLSSTIGSLLLLVDNTGGNTSLKNFIKNTGYGNMFVYGGSSVISNQTINDISQYLSSNTNNITLNRESNKIQGINTTDIKISKDKLENNEFYQFNRSLSKRISIEK